MKYTGRQAQPFVLKKLLPAFFEGKDRMHDVFISYRWVDPDQRWVREQLAPALRNAGLAVLLDVDDFVPGRDLILEMTRAGHESRRVLCVLSPDYFDGNRMVAFELDGATA